ncbi:hypothetical protein, partial [Bradyrhizobium pachyrhizi]|uniref:hypothetical protein n=1 Tax=Bradyrhizobium pachyrhizi TaxID=280333 RepID=UPI001AEBF83F
DDVKRVASTALTFPASPEGGSATRDSSMRMPTRTAAVSHYSLCAINVAAHRDHYKLTFAICAWTSRDAVRGGPRSVGLCLLV